MNNEEVVWIIILLIVVIIAVLILSLTPANTNPKNLTVDSAQLTQSTQKAKPGKLIILITLGIVGIAGLIAVLNLKSKTGDLTLRSQTGSSISLASTDLIDQIAQTYNQVEKGLYMPFIGGLAIIISVCALKLYLIRSRRRILATRNPIAQRSYLTRLIRRRVYALSLSANILAVIGSIVVLLETINNLIYWTEQ